MRKSLIALFLLTDLVLVAAVLWFIAPRESWPSAADIATVEPGADLEAWLASREAAVPGITPGAEKAILWAGEAGQRTPLALVYLHGFSATRQEVSPLPETLAQALGANLFATRLTGHGLPGEALGAATVADWAADIAEAMAVGQRLGERVVLIGTSTGGSMAVLAALDPAYREAIAGIVLISPNFAINSGQAWVLDMPFAASWVPAVMGETRSWEPQNEGHGRFWTTSYPTAALFPMRVVQRASQDADHSAATVPALVFYATGDTVVRSDATEAVIARWGAPVEAHVVTDADDPGQHVIAGDILSPTATPGILRRATDWLQRL